MKNIYAIVDIETTGSTPPNDGITEIGVVITDGENILEKYETLINPEVHIPKFVVGLTGITNQMVADQPKFEDVSSELYDLLEGKIFVAHNVNFDYKFIKESFKKVGVEYNSKRLCTIRLSRQIIPGHASYSLGKLTKSVGIELKNAHRAMGDTLATTELFHMLHVKDVDFINASLKANSKEYTLPANLSKNKYKKLPKFPGVYYFHDAKGKVIYIGKAKDIRGRVSSHFTGKLTKKNEVFFKEIYDVSYELTGNELIAAFLEDNEIKRTWPLLNRSQKSRIDKFGIYVYTDRKEMTRIGINKVNNHFPFIKAFPTQSEARNWLIKMVDAYNLNPSFCGMSQFDSDQVTEEMHDKNIDAFLDEFDLGEESFVLQGRGREREEHSFIYVDKGTYKGFGYFPKSESISSVDELQNYLQPQKETVLIRNLLKSELKKKKSYYKKVILQ